MTMQPGPSYGCGILEERLIPGTRKRAHSPDDHSCKSNKCSITFILQSESDQPTDEDNESVYSVQLEDTASAKDTSDTSSSSESVMDAEFELASLSEEKLFTDDSSSGTEGLLAAVGVLAASVEDDPAFWADSSDTDSDCSRDSEVPRADYWTCLRCKCRNNNPLFRYCERCFQIRKDYFPERPKRSQHQRTVPRRKLESVDVAVGVPVEKDDQSDLELSNGAEKCDLDSLPGDVLPRSEQRIDSIENIRSSDSHAAESPLCKEDDFKESQETVAISDSAVESDLSQSLLQGSSSSLTVQTSGPASSNTMSELCFMCVQHPKNGCFIHKKTVHILCCYTCTVKVWNRTRKCPLCNEKPLKIARVIFG